MRPLSCLLVAVLSTAIALGQSQGNGSAASSSTSSSSAPAAAYGYIPLTGNSQTDTSTDVSNPNTPWLPVLINGETISLLGEIERSNQLSFGMTVASGYDDNTLTQNSRQIGNASFSFLPSMSWHESKSRSLFDLNYSPGFTVNQRLPELNNATHNAGFNSQFRLTENITWRIHDAFVASNNGWTNTNPEMPTNALHEPNQLVLTPLADTVSNLAGTDLVYQMGAGTILGGSGSYSLLNYSNVQGGPGVQLIDSRTAGGDIFYQHRLLPKHWIGLTYGFQRFTFNGGVEETDTHSALLFYTAMIRPHFVVSLFGGGTHTQTDGFVAIATSATTPTGTRTQWSPSAGAIFGWETPHTGITATFSRRVDSGGGILGTVERNSGMATVQRQFSPNWTGTISFVFDNNRPLDSMEGVYRTLSETVAVERRLGRQMSMVASYTRAHQTYGIAIPTQLFPDHNRAMLSISYFVSRPLGR
jgi:hypothetical protein